jgi:transcriptional regulator with GAF, ATPase, and Fis domain/ABC-type multidrug transport system fused ATPase/permease subunit
VHDRRRAILKASAIAIIAYAIVVVVYANLVPYIGLRFFVQSVQRISASPADRPEDPTLPSPQIGDRLIEIAGQKVEPDRSPLGTIVNTIANLNNPQKFDPTPLPSIADLSTCESGVAAVAGERFVRLRFEPVDPSDARGVFDRWYRVTEPPMARTWLSLAWLALESVVFWLGWLVFRRRPDDDAAALFFLMCIVTVGAYMGWYHWLEIASNPPLVFVFAACALAVPQVSLHFHLVAPAPKRFLLRYPRWTLLALYLVPGAVQLAVLWAVSRMFYTFRHQLPDAGMWWQAALGSLLWIYIALGGLMFLGCLASLWHSYRFPRQPAHRDQVRWLLGGSCVAALFIAYTFWTAIFDSPSFLVGDATWAMFGASLSFIAAYAVSILRYRLLSIDEIVEQRGWKYLIIRLLGAVTFFGLIVSLILLTPRIFSGVSQPEGLLIASFLVLVLYILNTIRGWLAAVLDRRFYRERSRIDWAIRKMNEAVGNLIDPPTVRHRSLVIAADGMHARSAAVYHRVTRSGYVRAETVGDDLFPDRIDASHPLVERMRAGGLLQKTANPLLREDAATQLLRSVGAELAQPLLYDEKLLGFLLLGPRREGMYNSADLAYLAGIADLAALALHSAQSQQTLEKLNADLRSRVARVSAPHAPASGESPPARLPAEPAAPPLDAPAATAASPALGEILRTVEKVAASNATVLIRGESGTGKTMLAEIIHKNSPRAAEPFVKVHCAALSPTLLESELFGHVKGAFTGAHRDKVGRFQLADRGTLFLDEIGDVSIETQTKLLRVLQERTFEPVGATESIRVDVRIIAATHQPLEDLIRAGRIREDLYYRLNVISIRMPSLRERRGDVPSLADHFLRTYAEQSKKTILGFEPEAMELLQSYHWPGNIRELQNVVEHAVVMASSAYVKASDLPIEISLPPPPPRAPYTLQAAAAHDPLARRNGSLAGEIDDIERMRLAEAMQEAGGNKSRAARLLGIPRSTLCSKLAKYGIA